MSDTLPLDTLDQQPEPAQAPEPTPAPDPAPAPPAERMFTQAELDRAIKDRVARERRKHQPKQPPPPQPTPDTDVSADLAAMQRKMTEMEFEAAALRRGVSNETVLRTLRSAYIAEGAQDVIAWLDERQALFVPAEVAAPAPEAEEPEVAPAPEPGKPEGAVPTQAQPLDGLVDPTKLTKDDIARLQRSGKFHETLERYRDQLPGGGNGVFRKKTPGA